MMRPTFSWRPLLVAAAIAAMSAISVNVAFAADHCASFFRIAPWWPDCIGKYCCDDYCVKPLPAVCPVKCFCCDDYCPKPLPCIYPVKCFVCDDYCPKPLPCFICPKCNDYKCVPTCSCPKCQAVRAKMFEHAPADDQE